MRSLGEVWCRGSELNQRREALQASALPLSYPGNDKNYQCMQLWYLFVDFCQQKYYFFLQYNGFALPAIIALGTGIKSPVITSKIYAYIGMFDGING
jgi:hypothetical protein